MSDDFWKVWGGKHRKTYLCSICHKTFFTEIELAKHQAVHHPYDYVSGRARNERMNPSRRDSH